MHMLCHGPGVMGPAELAYWNVLNVQSEFRHGQLELCSLLSCSLTAAGIDMGTRRRVYCAPWLSTICVYQ